MKLFKSLLLCISTLSWILTFVIALYSIYLSVSVSSISPILLLFGFTVIGYLSGFIIYESCYFVQKPILIMVNKLFYKENSDNFIKNRVSEKIGIGFFVFAVFLFLRNILIFNFTFNFFWYSKDKFQLNYSYNFFIVFIIGLVWSLSSRLSDVKKVSYCFASALNPIFYCLLFLLNLSFSHLFFDYHRAEIKYIFYASAILLFWIITPIFYFLAKREFAIATRELAADLTNQF